MKLGLLSLVVGLAVAIGCSSTPARVGISTPSSCDSCSENFLSVAPAAIDFGSLPGGSTTTRNLTLTNNGSAAITNLTATLAFDPTAAFEVGPCPSSLAGGTTATLTITYVPPVGGSGAVTDQLTFNAGASGELDSTMVLLTGRASLCGCAPNVLSFGAVAVSRQAPTQTLNCTNWGSDSCELTFGPGNLEPAFNLTDANGPILPGSVRTFTADEGYVFTVAFTPPVAGDMSAALTIANCSDPNICAGAGVTPESISLSGTGVGCELAITPNPIVFSSTDTTQTVAVTNIGTLPAAVTCLSLGDAGCGASTPALAFSNLPALPATLAPSSNLTFTLTASGDAGGTLNALCALTGSAVTATFSAPLSTDP